MAEITTPTPEQVLATPMPDGAADAATIRDYLTNLLMAVWEAHSGASGMLAIGEYRWQYDLYDALAAAGHIPWDETIGGVSDEAARRGHALVVAAIRHLGMAMPQTTVAGFAQEAAKHLAENFPENDLLIQQVLCLAEEAGEFVGAYRRWAGMARRTGSFADVCAELADVVITAYVTANVLDIDLDAAIREKTAVISTRGWRDRPAAGGDGDA